MSDRIIYPQVVEYIKESLRAQNAKPKKWERELIELYDFQRRLIANWYQDKATANQEQ